MVTDLEEAESREGGEESDTDGNDRVARCKN